MRFVIIIGIILFLNGCANSLQNMPPQWFLQNPNDNSYLYGNGSGKNIQEAKNNAINDIASNIKVKVNSNTTLINSEIDNKQTSNLSQNINLSLSNIQLQDIIQTQSEYKNHQYYIQIKVPKESIIQNLKQEYMNLYDSLAYLKQNKCSSISINEESMLKHKLQSLSDLSQTLHVLSNQINLVSLGFYQQILKDNSPKPKAKIIFNTNDKEYSNALNAEYAKFFINSDKNNIQAITNTLAFSKEGDKIKLSLEVNIQNCENKSILNFQISSKEKDKDDAIQRLKAQLYKKLKSYKNDDF